MDWPVTARTQVPHVRETIADRELETWAVVDLSASLDFGTANCQKRDLAIAGLAAVGHLTVHGGNRLGAVVTTGERVDRYPAHARPAGRRAAAALASSPPRGPPAAGAGDLAAALETLRRPPRRRGLVVVISDFLGDSDWERPLRGLSARHELLAIEVVDPRELELPDVGLLTVVDPETGQTLEVPTGNAEFRARFADGRGRAAGADRRGAAPGRRRPPAAAHRPRLADGRRPVRRRPPARRQRRSLPMTFQSPLWLLALLVVAALVAFYVRAAAAPEGATPRGSPTSRCSARWCPSGRAGGGTSPSASSRSAWPRSSSRWPCRAPRCGCRASGRR